MAEAYDKDNIFAKILRGELPCHRVCENDRTLAFLDLFPRAAGHTLVIPKAPSRNILDILPDDLAAVAETARRVASAAKKVFSADGVTVQQFSEAAGGQEVFHTHIHIIPRLRGVALKPPASEMAAQDELRKQAELLREALANS